jgi:uncharacterized membrane protein
MTSIPVAEPPVARPPAPVGRSKAKIVFFVLFLAVTAFVTMGKNAHMLDPNSEIAQHYAPAKWFLAVHASFGALALVLGVVQFSNRLRAQYTALHRALGYVYVASVFIAGPFAIPVASKIGSPSLVAASCVQTFGWMACTALALYAIRLGNIAQHRRWMLRGYPFAMVFTVTRMIIPLPPVLRSGVTGIEIVVWCTVAAAAFLPSIVLDWRSLVPTRRRTALAA